MYFVGVLSCPVCDQKGLFISFKADESSFEYESNQVKLIPKSTLQIYFPWDVTGGTVTAVKNENYLKLQMRLNANIISAKFNELNTILVKSGHSEDALLMKKYGNKINANILKLQTILEKGTLYMYSAIANQLAVIKDDSNDCMAQVKLVRSRFRGNSRIEIITRILMYQFKRFHAIEVQSNDQKISLKEQGKIISYQGKFCFYRMCLSEVDVDIYDLDDSLSSDTQCNNDCKSKYKPFMVKDSIVITVSASKEMQLTPRIKLVKGNGFKLVLNKHTNSLSGEIVASVKHFDLYYKTKFVIDDNDVKFEVNDVKLPGDLIFTLSGKTNVMTVKWESLVYNVKGISYQLAKDLKTVTQNIYKNISAETTKRLQGTVNRVNEAQKNLVDGKSEVAESQKQLKLTSDRLRLNEAAYKRNLLQMQTTQKEFDSYIKTLDPLFIKKNVEKVCLLKTCPESCVSMPVCDICQDPLVIDVTTLKCEQKKETIRTSTEVPFKTQCDLTKYAFIPVYTGSCSPDPNIQAQSDAQLKQSLIATGTAVGSMIGSVIPGIGTVIGGAIGAVVGFIAGLFSSCDESYEVYTKKWIEQVPCVLVKTGVSSVTREFSVCYDVKKKVQTGFKAPYSCNCKVNNCIVKAKDQTCLVANQNCQKNRQLFLKQADNVPARFVEVYTKLKQFQDNVASSQLKVQAARKSNAFQRRDYERLSNGLRVKEEESKFSKKSHTDVTSILKTETCIMNHHKSDNDVSTLITIKNVQFDITLPLVDNIRLNINVKHKGTDALLPFVYSFDNDKEISLNAAAKKIITQTLCKSTRRRRSASEDDVLEDLSFKSWYVEDEITASAVELSCVTLKKTLGFLRSTVKKLEFKTKDASTLKQQLEFAERSLIPTMSLAFTADTNLPTSINSVMKANRDLLLSTAKELSTFGNQVSPPNVIKLWQEQSEVFTGFNNISICLGYSDCVDEAIYSLINLPTIFKIPRAIYVQKVYEIKDKIKLLYGQRYLDGIDKLARNIETLITSLEHMTLHCSAPPKVTLKNPQNIITSEGKIVTLECTANSKLPVTYFWRHHENLIDGQHGNTLSIIASAESEGIYSCFVKSLVGNGTTNGTQVTIFSSPKFIEEPKDVVFVTPASNVARFICNATAVPKPTIVWYFRAMTSTDPVSQPPVLLRGQTSPLLVFEKPTISNAGFYYCKAYNRYGNIQSKVARFDVVTTVITKSEFKVSFEALKATGIKDTSFSKLSARMMKETADVMSNMQVNVHQVQDNTKITMTVTVNPKVDSQLTTKGMLTKASKSRQDIANAAAVLLNTLLLGRSKLTLDDGRIIDVDNDTITFDLKVNICAAGYKLHKNGFMCGR